MQKGAPYHLKKWMNPQPPHGDGMPPHWGNVGLLALPERVAFLSSRRIAPADVLRCCDWAAGMRGEGACVLGGFQSPLERDVLRFLLRGHVPVVMALARPLWKVVPENLRGPLDDGRLLVVAPLEASAGCRASETSAFARNRWILEHCTRLVVGALDPAGLLARLLEQFPDLPRRNAHSASAAAVSAFRGMPRDATVHDQGTEETA